MYRDYLSGVVAKEPAIDDVLQDPMIKMLMRSDGVSDVDMRNFVDKYRHRSVGASRRGCRSTISSSSLGCYTRRNTVDAVDAGIDRAFSAMLAGYGNRHKVSTERQQCYRSELACTVDA